MIISFFDTTMAQATTANDNLTDDKTIFLYSLVYMNVLDLSSKP